MTGGVGWQLQAPTARAAASVPGKIGTPVLQVEHMSKQYPGGRHALDDVSLVVAAGELVIVLGANGSGKSTLLRCVALLIEPTAGSVRVAGRDLAHLRGRELRKARLALAMIFQQPNLVRRRSALANVATGSLGRHQGLATAFGRLPRDALLDSAALLDRLGMLHLANKRADTLSGGEAQRVAIARALAQQPRVLLADEPVSSLDPEAAEDVLLLLAELATRDNLGIVCVLHQPQLALRHAHRLVGLRHGRVTFDAPVARVDLESIAALYRSDQP